ncbi:MAG: hypothetical protein AB7L94_35280, partial [Kofleriaceae bacterium]
SASHSQASRMGPEMLETRRGDLPSMMPPPAVPSGQPQMSSPHMPMQHNMASPPPGQMMQPQSPFAVQSSPQLQPLGAAMSSTGMPPYGAQPQYPVVQNPQAMLNNGGMPMYPQASTAMPQNKGSVKWIWWVVGLLALGAAAGAVLALVMRS